MMELPTGYTPSPWRVLNGDPIGVGGTPRNPIATIYPSNDADFMRGEGRGEPEDRANADLIALAPEMAHEIVRLEAENARLTAERDKLRDLLPGALVAAENIGVFPDVSYKIRAVLTLDKTP